MEQEQSVCSGDGASGVEMITAERQRQVSQEKWSAEHDDTHSGAEMALMAAHYTLLAAREDCADQTVAGPEANDLTRLIDLALPLLIPFGWWPSSKAKIRNLDGRIGNLVRAGALIAAEIDRLQRVRKPDMENSAQENTKPS